MKRFQRLSYEERVLIEECLKKGYTLRRTGLITGRAQETIQTEVQRNGGRVNYKAIEAQKRFCRLKKGMSEQFWLPIKEFEKGEEKGKVSTAVLHKNNFEKRLDNIEQQIEIILDHIKKGTT